MRLWWINMMLMSMLFQSYAQKGVLTVRKESHQLIGKTLLLQDSRGSTCGSIKFINDTASQLFLKIVPERSYLNDSILNTISFKKTKNTYYTILNDTSLILKDSLIIDTCYYVYYNNKSNLVRFNTKIIGQLYEGDYTLFYDLDSILYSQSYRNTLKSKSFTDSLLLIDSLFKEVKDKNRREVMEKEFKKNARKYKNQQEVYFFKGRYHQPTKTSLSLYNDKNEKFSSLQLIDTLAISPKVESHDNLEANLVLTSEYSRYHYGIQKNCYDKTYILYYHPDKYQIVENTIVSNPISIDTFSIYYGSSIKIKNENDSIQLDYLENLGSRFRNRLGGYYQTELVSKNGNRVKYKDLYFKEKKAYELTADHHFLEEKAYSYMLKDSALFLYLEKDTLIDELKNSWLSFSFSYKNQEPYVFGIYHADNKEKNKHKFIILFPNFTGITYTTNDFEYKEAREILANYSNPKKANDMKSFTYESSENLLWLTFDDGDYKKLKFFNHHKGIQDIEIDYIFIK